MPIETPAGTLEVENAKFRASSVEATIAVGIGTESNDAYPLQVFKETSPDIRLSEGSTISSAARFYSNNSNLYIQTGTNFTSGSSGDIAFQTMAGQSTHMVIKSDGKVGVGTTSPGSKLDIYTGSTSTVGLSLDRFSSGNYRTDIYQNSYGPDFRVGYDSYTPESILYLKRLSDGSKEVEINGNVGIGTTSPVEKLDVRGNAYLENNSIFMSGYNEGPTNNIEYSQYVGKRYSGRILAGMEIENVRTNSAGTAITNDGHYSQKLHFRAHDFGLYGGLVGDRTMSIVGGNVGIRTASPDYNLEVNGSVGVSGKQMYPMLRWEIDLTSQSNSNFYPIEFTHPVSGGTPDLPDLHPIHFKVFGESLGGGDPYNENTLVGYAKGGGWSDHGPMYDVHIKRFVATEHRFQGVYEGQNIAMEQIVIYMRGGYRYSAITDATSVVTHTSAYTIPDNTYPTTFAIKNSSGTDVSGTSAQISQLVNLAANARRSERFMSGDLHVDGYIKNSTTPSWSLYFAGSPSPTTSGYLSFNNTKASGINCTLNTSAGLTSRVTITVAGRYFIGFNGFTESNVSANTGVNYEIRINGTTLVRGYHVQPIANYSAMSGLGGLADLSVNDYVEINSTQQLHHSQNASFYGFMIA